MNNDELTDEMKQKINDAQNELVNIILQIDNKKFLTEFFHCLLTPNECFDFGKRWLLVKEINNGKTQRDIAKDFKMSLCKITRGSKELKKDDSAFRKILDAMDETSELIKSIE